LLSRTDLGKVLLVSELRKIVLAYMAADDRKEAWVAKEMGISRSALNGWWNRGRTSAPSSELLRALARVTRTPYRSVLDAALIDFGYLPEEGQAYGKPPAEKTMSDLEREAIEAEDYDPDVPATKPPDDLEGSP
jgi:transcriptional regulator with XRE-family HTH domain